MNKGDPNAQKKFVDLSAAYEVLKNADKRAQYDAQRQYGSGSFGGGFGQSQGYQQQSQAGSGSSSYTSNQQRGGYNPFRQNGGNPYWQPESSSASGEDFMKWYRSHFRDSFHDFDEFNRGQTTIIEERMPDGSIRIRVIRSGPRASSRRPDPFQQQQQQANPFSQPHHGAQNMEEAFQSLFGRSNAAKFFGSLFRDGFKNAGQNTYEGQDGDSNNSNNGIPFGSGYLDFPSARITEVFGELAFVLSSGRHIGTMRHRVLSGDQGEVLTCTQDAKVLAKARSYLRNGAERILIENGDSRRIATIEAIPQVAPIIEQNMMEKGSIGLFSSIKNALSLHYQIFDDNERLSGFMTVSPFRRTIRFYDTRGDQVAIVERKDIDQINGNTPTRDDWELTIQDSRLFDSSVFIFPSAFSTISERNSNFPLPGAIVLFKALSKKLQISGPKQS